MVRSSWSALLALDGYTTVVGVAEEVLVTIERGLGIEFPAELRSLYAASDGVYDEVGQWWVIWPLERVTTQNHGPERIADLPPNLMAFGDNGAGDPLCVATDADAAVYCWSAIERQARVLAADLPDFWMAWVAGTLTT